MDQLLFGERFECWTSRGRLGLGPGAPRRLCGLRGQAASLRPGRARRRPTGSRRCAPTPSPSPASSRARRAAIRSTPWSASRRVEGGFAKVAGAGWMAADAPVADRRGSRTDCAAVAERFVGRALSVGRPREPGPGLLGPGAAGAVRLRPGLPARHRPAAGAGRADRRPADFGAATWCSGRATWRSCSTTAASLHANAHHMAMVVEPLAEARRAHRGRGVGRADGVPAAALIPGKVAARRARRRCPRLARKKAATDGVESAPAAACGG